MESLALDRRISRADIDTALANEHPQCSGLKSVPTARDETDRCEEARRDRRRMLADAAERVVALSVRRLDRVIRHRPDYHDSHAMRLFSVLKIFADNRAQILDAPPAESPSDR